MAYAVSASNTLDKNILHDLDSTGITTDDGQLGLEVLSTDGRKYKRMLLDSGSALAIAGGPIYYMGGTIANTVTTDYDEGENGIEALGTGFAGVSCVAADAATSTYLWVEIPNGQLIVDASCSTEVTASAGLMAINDLYFQIADSDARIVAIAMEADTNQKADIILLR